MTNISSPDSGGLSTDKILKMPSASRTAFELGDIKHLDIGAGNMLYYPCSIQNLALLLTLVITQIN